MAQKTITIRIRGRGEATQEEQCDLSDTVSMFKQRVFAREIAEGRQCRLVAGGKELHDNSVMSSYGLEDGSFVHVVIGAEGTAARAARYGNPNGGRRGTSSGGGSSVLRREGTSNVGLCVLGFLTFGLVVASWAALLMWPQFFTLGSKGLLLLLTSMHVALFLPVLRKAVSGVARRSTAREHSH